MYVASSDFKIFWIVIPDICPYVCQSSVRQCSFYIVLSILLNTIINKNILITAYLKNIEV